MPDAVGVQCFARMREIRNGYPPGVRPGFAAGCEAGLCPAVRSKNALGLRPRFGLSPYQRRVHSPQMQSELQPFRRRSTHHTWLKQSSLCEHLQRIEPVGPEPRISTVKINRGGGTFANHLVDCEAGVSITWYSEMLELVRKRV